MSSRNQAPCETAPLLDASQAGQSRSRSLSRERVRLSPETLIIPVVLAIKLGALIPTTTIIELLRQTVCGLSISYGDPVIEGGPNPSDLCDSSKAVQLFSTVVAILGIVDGIISMCACGILSRISSHHGRKPAFLFLLTIGIAGSCLIPGSRYVPDWLAHWTFIAGMLCQLFSGQVSYAYLVNMYIVDVCAPEARTAVLSKIGGWAALGACVPFAVGGSITTKTGNPLIVLYIATAMFVLSLIYVIFILPETFPEEKRSALSGMRQESTTRSVTSRLAQLNVLEPLKMLFPTRTMGGTRNWRLTWCAMHTFVFVTASAHAPPAWLVLATSKNHLTPAETGLFLTVVTASASIILAVIVPTVVRFLRPYYRRKATGNPLADDSEDPLGNEQPGLETSDHLDVHLAFVSCVIVAVSYLCAAASTTSLALVASGIFIGFSFVHTPAVRSLIVGSVDPLKQGEALAAIEMVNSAGGVLSPIIMGSILTATVNTMPLFFFYVHLAIVLVSATMLFLVRDADRYQVSTEI